jgi:anti-sigma factor RsiW
MCDFADKLIAWIDGELAQEDAAQLERHTGECEQCRRYVASYKEISAAIVSHGDARWASQVQSQPWPWAPVFALAAAAVVIFFLARQGGVVRHASQTQASEVAHAGEPGAAKALVALPRGPASKPLRKHRPEGAPVDARSPAHESIQDVKWIPQQSAIEITIPVESMFAPGAVPQGVSFSAELVVAADGSAQSIRLRP